MEENLAAPKGSKIGLIIAIIAVVLIALAGGVFWFLNNRSGVIKTQDGGLIKYKQKGNEVTTKQGSATLITGDNVSKPKDFPSNIPLYPKATYSSFLTDNQMYGYTATTSDKAETILAYFKGQVVKAGWKIDLETKNSLNISNDTLAGGIVIAPNGDKNDINFSSFSKTDAVFTGTDGQQSYDDTIRQAQELQSQAEDEGLLTE